MNYQSRKFSAPNSLHQNLSSTPNKKYQNASPLNEIKRSETPTYKNMEHRQSSISQPKHSLTSDRRKQEQQNFSVHLDRLIKEMTEKKQKLEKYIKIFNLMQNHNSQIRCLDHSNVLTIYCQTQHRALCANCVYGFNRHRTHKLIPLKDANDFIIQDNAVLWSQINEDLRRMDDGIKSTQDNTILLQKQLKKHLRRAQEEFINKSDQLKQTYHLKRQNIQKCYEGLIEKSKRVERIIEEFKIKVWEILSKIGIGKRGDNNNAELEIGKQVTCVSMASITGMSIKKISSKDLAKLQHKLDRL